MLEGLFKVRWGTQEFDEELLSIRMNDVFDDRQDTCEVKLRGVHNGRRPVTSTDVTPEEFSVIMVDPDSGVEITLGEYRLRDGYRIAYSPESITTIKGDTLSDDDDMLTEFRNVLGGKVVTVTGMDGKPDRQWTFVADDVERWHELALFEYVRDDSLFSDMRRTLREGIGIDTADALRQRFAGEPDGAAYADGLFALAGMDAAAIYIITAQALFELMASQSAADWLRTANKYQMTVRPRPAQLGRYDLYTLAEAERYPLVTAGTHCGISEQNLEVAYPLGWADAQNWKYARFLWTTEKGEEGRAIEGRSNRPSQIIPREIKLQHRYQVDDPTAKWSYTAALQAELMRIGYSLNHSQLRCTLAPLVEDRVDQIVYLAQNARAGGAFNPMPVVESVLNLSQPYFEGRKVREWVRDHEIMHISNQRYALQIWEAVHDITNAGYRVTVTCRPSEKVVL